MARFTPHTEEDVREMLDAIGVETLDDLFADVSPKFEGTLGLPSALSEYEALGDVDRLAKKNDTGLPIFLGAGAYDRIVPSTVGTIISRGEFLTSYTPYQPEISQGTLRQVRVQFVHGPEADRLQHVMAFGVGLRKVPQVS